MKYLGAKTKLAKPIARFLESIREPGQMYIEPFLGSAAIGSLMKNPRIGSDVHPDLIMLLREVRDSTFDYPKELTKDMYASLKTSPPSALRAFAGFGMSFAGKWFGGYAKSGLSRGRRANLGKSFQNPLRECTTSLKRI